MASSQSEQTTKLHELSNTWRELYDLAVRAGVQSCLEQIAKDQASKLSEIVWHITEKDRYFDANTLVSEIILYMARQCARRGKKKYFSRRAMVYLTDGLLLLRNNGAITPKNVARFIGVYRWVHEICSEIHLKINWNRIPTLTMDDFIDLLKS